MEPEILSHAGRSQAIRAALDELAVQGEVERGAVFTRAEVVDAILDLARYTADQPLHTRRLLEPIGNIPPAEAEAAYHAQLETSGVAA